MRSTLLATVVTALLLALFLFFRLSEFDVPDAGGQQTLRITHGSDSLAGTLILPAGVSSPPVALLVHGDGAQDRWSDGGYLPLVNHLVSQGIAVFSWDKPGVGESTGNWLAQTMDDRALEAAFILQQLRQQPALAHSRLGFVGFSQAGWVVPQASQLAQADFAVLVGPAINWRNQGAYYLRQRLQLAGQPANEITRAVANDTAAFDAHYTQETTSRPCAAVCTRNDFERRNALADARVAIGSMQTPVMVLMGQDDRNVDSKETLAVWRARLPVKTPHCLRLIPAATHGLLNSRWYDYQLASQWPAWKQGVFLLSGRKAYAAGALDMISGWIRNGACPD